MRNVEIAAAHAIAGKPVVFLNIVGGFKLVQQPGVLDVSVCISRIFFITANLVVPKSHIFTQSKICPL